MAGREHLDNLIFVVNCNLQRLDGPVRGNGKIIQEAEAMFRGAGWNVIKVIWGSKWDELLARDVDGVLLDKMNTTPDGEFQKYATESGAYIREHFFGPDPRLRRLVEHLSDEDLQALPRGGHDYRKLYAAYKLATEQVGQPTVILAKTVKGWTLGPEIEARNATHQIKKMTKAQLLALRDRLYLQEEIPDEALDADQPPYYRPPEGSPAHEYLSGRRKVLAGPLPDAGRPARHALRRARRTASSPTCSPARASRRRRRRWPSPACCATSSATRPWAATSRPSSPTRPAPSASSRSSPSPRSTPPRASATPRSTPTSSSATPRTARARSSRKASPRPAPWPSFIALATAYATWGRPMLPIYLFYSMFGFQRIGDLAWLLGDIRGRGILAGCTAGRTTLQGEGLQHDDGHSPLLASVNPAAHIYDPAFAYEIGVIMEDAVAKIMGPEPEDRFWYLTLYNENYAMPPAPRGRRPATPCGPASCAACTASPSRPSCTRGRRRGRTNGVGRCDGHAAVLGPDVAGGHGGPRHAGRGLGRVGRRLVGDLVHRAARGRPVGRAGQPAPSRTASAPVPYVTELARTTAPGPVVAVTDYLRAVPDQVARWVPRPFISLGTDGFGRSDTRAALRRFFEVDAAHSWWPSSARWPRPATPRPTRWPRPSAATRSTPTPPIPGPTDRSGPPYGADGSTGRLVRPDRHRRATATGPRAPSPARTADPIENAEKNEPIDPIEQRRADRADRQERALAPDRQARSPPTTRTTGSSCSSSLRLMPPSSRHRRPARGVTSGRPVRDRLVQAIVLVTDLESARRRMEALGLTVLDGGRHPGRGTANLIVALRRPQYLELLAVVDEAEALSSPQGRPVVAALARRGPGLARWSVETDRHRGDGGPGRAPGRGPSPRPSRRDDGPLALRRGGRGVGRALALRLHGLGRP